MHQTSHSYKTAYNIAAANTDNICNSSGSGMKTFERYNENSRIICTKVREK